MKALIFHARAYSFTGRDGSLIEGNTVSYIEDMPVSENPNEAGLPPQTVPALDEALADVLQGKLPGLFDIDMGRRPGPKGKPETILTRAKFLSPVPVANLLGGAVAPAPAPAK